MTKELPGQLGPEQEINNERNSLRKLSNKLLIHAGFFLATTTAGVPLLLLGAKATNFLDYGSTPASDIVIRGTVGGFVAGTFSALYSIRYSRNNNILPNVTLKDEPKKE